VKHADNLALLAKEETALQGTTDRVIESGRCCGMEISVEITKVMRISRQQSRVQIMMRQKQLKNVKYINCLCNVITNDTRFTREIKSRISITKAAFIKKRDLSPSKLELKLRKKLVMDYILTITVYGAETWTFSKVGEKYLEFFDVWCWRRMKNQLDRSCEK